MKVGIKMNKKKTLKVTGGIAAVITAVIVAVSGGQKEVDIDYTIYNKNEYISVMEIDTPEESNIDIVELYLNGEEVDKTLLPNGSFESIPMVFEDLSRLELKLYRKGKCVGTAKFNNTDLKANVKEDGNNA